MKLWRLDKKKLINLYCNICGGKNKKIIPKTLQQYLNVSYKVLRNAYIGHKKAVIKG